MSHVAASSMPASSSTAIQCGMDPSHPDVVFLRGAYNQERVRLSNVPVLPYRDVELLLNANTQRKKKECYTIFRPRSVSKTGPDFLYQLGKIDRVIKYISICYWSGDKIFHGQAPYDPRSGKVCTHEGIWDYFLFSKSQLKGEIYLHSAPARELAYLRDDLESHCISRDSHKGSISRLEKAECGTYFIERTDEPHRFVLYNKEEGRVQKTFLRLFYHSSMPIPSLEPTLTDSIGIRIEDPKELDLFENVYSLGQMEEELNLTSFLEEG